MKQARNECTFSVFSENSPGVLQRITALFTRRKLNIESLTVSHTEVDGMSRFTIVLAIPLETAAKVAGQLRRIVEVHHVEVHANDALIYKEIAFFRVATPDAAARQYIAHAAVRHGASVVSIDPEALVIEKTGTEDEIERLYHAFKPLRIMEFIRSGRIAVKKHLFEATRGSELYTADNGEVVM